MIFSCSQISNETRNLSGLPPGPGVRAEAEPVGGEVVVVVEIDTSAIVEVGFGGTGADEPLGSEIGQVGQIDDAPGGGGPKAAGQDVGAAGHKPGVRLPDGALQRIGIAGGASAAAVNGGPGDVIGLGVRGGIESK